MNSSCDAPLDPAFFSHNHFSLSAIGLQIFVTIVSVVCIDFFFFSFYSNIYVWKLSVQSTQFNHAYHGYLQ
jgi:hypothetical protein